MARLVLLLSVLQRSCCWSFRQPLRAANAQAAWQSHSGQRVSASGLRRRHLTTASADRGAARVGLLDGVGDPDKADVYSTTMDLGRAAQMALHRGIIYQAAESDAEKMGLNVQDYLKDIDGKASPFIHDDEIVNREELQQALDEVVNEEGKFVCLLGGKSTGKSLLLEDLAARHPGKVWVVKLLVDRTILGGLVRTLPERLPLEKWAAVVSQVLQGSKAGAGRPLQLLVDAMISELGAVTIVVDEARIAFTVGPRTEDSDIDEMKAALEYFTSFSKQRKKGNVILVTSEHAFPVGLTRELGFNLDHFTGFLYAGEPRPKDMLRVLRERWGVGPHLAHALVAHYGGHVWDTYLALSVLGQGGSTAFEVGLDPGKSSRVHSCLAWRPEGPGDVKEQQGRLRELLKLLAIRGFAPIPTRDDELAEVISRHNVGGVVQRNALVVGLPRDAWGSGDNFGLVPATQAMRVAIANALVFEAEKRG